MQVVFRPQAEDDLDALYDYLVEQSGDPDMAFEMVWRLRSACKSLADFPERGSPRHEIRKGLRILVVEKRSVIAYHVKDVVEIIALFHGGQDWQTVLLQQEEPK
jgi:toxin ParE1/3/4